MQAGFLVALQAPIATQPRQLIQPLPTGTERPPVAVPQFDLALANAIMDGGSADQAAPPAPQSAASAQGVPAAVPSMTANALPMPGLPLPSSTGAGPTSSSKTVNRQGSLRQLPAGRIEPSAVPANQSPPAVAAIARDLGTVPPLIAGASETMPAITAVVVEKLGDESHQPSAAKPRRAAGDAPAPCDEGKNVADVSLSAPGAESPLLPEPQSIVDVPRESPQRRQVPPQAPDIAATRLPIAAAAPPEAAKARYSRQLSPPPWEPSARPAPSMRHGSLPNEQTEPAVPLQRAQGSTAADPLTMPPMQGLPGAALPVDRNGPPLTTLSGSDASPSPHADAPPLPPLPQRSPPAISGVPAAAITEGMATAYSAATSTAPVAAATTGVAETAGRASVRSEPRSTGAEPAPADLPRLAETLPEPLSGPVQAEQTTPSPAQHRLATVQPASTSETDPRRPATGSENPGQPATVPSTENATATSSTAAAAATGAAMDGASAQTPTPQIVQAETAASTLSPQQAGPSSRSASRTPANHRPLTAVTPAQAGFQPTASEHLTTAASSGLDTAEGAPISPSAHASAPIAIDAGPPAAPSGAPSPAAAVATPDDTSPTSRPASPAAQLAPVLVSLRHMADGTQRLTMRLDPPELGHVQVRIDRSPDASARVEITVEKAETLTLLLRDQPQLQHALDQAGVPAEGRSVTFHVASPEPAPRGEPSVRARAGCGRGRAQRRGLARCVAEWRPVRTDTRPARRTPATLGFTPVAPPGWARGGLDITA